MSCLFTKTQITLLNRFVKMC